MGATAAMPPEQLHVLAVQELLHIWYPTLQPVQIAAPSVAQDSAVAAVPPEKLHVLAVQEVPLKL